MAIIPIQLDAIREKRGAVLSLELSKEFGLSIVDAVLHTTKKGEKRGGHYHPRESGKVEVFVPLVGVAKLLWHDTSAPDKTYEELMHPIFQNEGMVYRVEPETCHQVVGESELDFMMIELSSAVYLGKRDPDCEHGLRVDRRQ